MAHAHRHRSHGTGRDRAGSRRRLSWALALAAGFMGVETGELPVAIRTAVHRRFGIDHVTVQVEAEPCGPAGSGRR